MKLVYLVMQIQHCPLAMPQNKAVLDIQEARYQPNTDILHPEQYRSSMPGSPIQATRHCHSSVLILVVYPKTNTRSSTNASVLCNPGLASSGHLTHPIAGLATLSSNPPIPPAITRTASAKHRPTLSKHLMRLQKTQLINALDDDLALPRISSQHRLELDRIARARDEIVPGALHEELALAVVALLDSFVRRHRPLEVRAPFAQAFVTEDAVRAQQGWERVASCAAEGVLGEGVEEAGVDH